MTIFIKIYKEFYRRGNILFIAVSIAIKIKLLNL